MSDLQNLPLEQKEKIVKEINTELTSIAEEEAKTGKTIAVPSPEKLVENMSVIFMQSRRAISDLLPKMSKKAIHRSVLAFLDLPTGEIPVYLKTDEEKMLFAFGQRAIQARFTIVQHHINKQVLEARAKKQQESEVVNESSEK